MLAIPLAWYHQSREAIIGWISFAYPLSNVMSNDFGIEGGSIGPFRLIEIAAGVGFSFDIMPSQRGAIGSGMSPSCYSRCVTRDATASH